MSHPIKIVEDSNQSPAKNISICQLNPLNQNQNIPNSSFAQSNKINSSFSSSGINNCSDFYNLQNNIFFNNGNSFKIKENKQNEYDSLFKYSSPIFKIDIKNSISAIKINEKIEPKNENELNLKPFIPLFNCKNETKSFYCMKTEISHKENNNQIINKVNDCTNFNNCPDEKVKNIDIKEYFRNLKEFSEKIVHTLEQIYKKNEYLLNISKDTDLNNSEKKLDNNSKKEEKKDRIIDNDLIKAKNIDKKEDNKLSPIFNNNFTENEKDVKPLLNANKSKNTIKSKNQDIEEENDNNKNYNSPKQTVKVKSLKRISSRKFNIKTRGLRYNILTEDMKKQLLLDAMNMRTVEVAKKYGISTRNVNRWKKKGIQRKKGSGRKFKDPRLERKILEWYKIQDKETLTSRQFKEKAIELSDNKTFRASSGWLTNMKRKYNINFKKY